MRDNSIIPFTRRFVTNELGENYWLHGCLRYVMEALGERDFDYEFFAGLTGDIFTQVYAFDHFRGDCATDYLLSAGESGFIEDLFARCGYGSEFVPDERVKAQSSEYLQRILDCIDRGVPVISSLVISGIGRWLVFVGYENKGGTLLFMTDNMTEPERVASAEVFAPSTEDAGWSRGLVFVGEKRGQADLPELHRLYSRMAGMWESDPDGLEAMGAGFNITPDALRDREKRGRIAAKLREYGGLAEQVLDILERGLGT